MNEFIEKYNSLIDKKKFEIIRGLTDDSVVLSYSQSGFYQLGYFPKTKFCEYCPLKHNLEDFILDSFTGRKFVLNSNDVNLELIDLLKQINSYGVLKLEDMTILSKPNIWLYGKKIIHLK